MSAHLMASHVVDRVPLEARAVVAADHHTLKIAGAGPEVASGDIEGSANRCIAGNIRWRDRCEYGRYIGHHIRPAMGLASGNDGDSKVDPCTAWNCAFDDPFWILCSGGLRVENREARSATDEKCIERKVGVESSDNEGDCRPIGRRCKLKRKYCRRPHKCDVQDCCNGRRRRW